MRRFLALILAILLTPLPALAQQGVLLSGNVSGTTTNVSIGSALPAGTNNIGDVDILSIAAGDNNIGNVDVLSIAAGDNNIGNVDIVTMPSVTIGTFPDNEPFNLAQYNGSSVGASNALHVQPGTSAVFQVQSNSANLATQTTLSSVLTSVQTIDDLVSVEDAVAGSGFSGIGMLAVRQDAQSNLAADGDFIPLTIDSAGGLRVSIVAGAGSGGTSATDDAAFAVASGTGTPAMFMFDDVAPDSINEGDVGVMRMSANRVGYFTIRDAAGNERGVNVNSSNELLVSCAGCSGSGASQIDDAAFSPGTDDGVMVMGMFDDVAPDSVNEGDGGAVRMSANRNLYVTIRDAAGNERGLNIDASGQLAVTGAVTVSGSVTANAGTNLNTSALALESGGNLATIAALSKAEDAAHASGHTGIMALSVRQDTAAALAGTDADYQPLITDASGRLHVNVGNTVTVGSHAVTNAGTFAVQESGAALTALQLIDNIVLAEDAASASTDPGVQMLAVRQSSPANTSGTNGDYEPLQVNGGRLWASVVVDTALPAGNNNIGDVDVVTLPGTGTEDAAETAGGTLVMAGTVRRNAAASSAGTDGDNATLNTDGVGALWVNPFSQTQAANTYLTVRITDGTNFASLGADWTASAAIGSTAPGQMLEAKDFDGAALPQTASAAEGDAIPAAGSLYGIQYVMLVSEDGSLERGTSTTPLIVSDGSGALNVICDSGCSGGAQKAEDAASADGDLGTVAMAVRKATPANTSGTDGDYEPLQVSAGRLWASATIDAALPAGGNTIGNVNPGTAANWAVYVEDAAETAGGNLSMSGTVRRDTAASSAGTSGDNATLNTDAVGKLWISGAFAEDAAHTSADIGVYTLGRRIDTLAASSGTSGDYESFNMAGDGALWSANVGATNGGGSVSAFASAASTNATNVKASAGQIYGIYLINTTATLYYLRLYNSSGTPTCSSATGYIASIPVPASTSGAGVALPFPIGAAFGTGIAYCFTGGASSTDNTNAATGVYGVIVYK